MSAQEHQVGAQERYTYENASTYMTESRQIDITTLAQGYRVSELARLAGGLLR